jgi:hypothetical protein
LKYIHPVEHVDEGSALIGIELLIGLAFDFGRQAMAAG